MNNTYRSKPIQQSARDRLYAAGLALVLLLVLPAMLHELRTPKTAWGDYSDSGFPDRQE
jgi:hypothetical protein